MAIEVKLPDLGENIKSGTIVSVMVSVGDDLVEDQSVVEIETDKAVVEVPSTAAGKVASVAVKEGDEVEIGGVLVTVDSEGGAPAEAKEEPAKEEAPAEEPAAKEEPAEEKAPEPAEKPQDAPSAPKAAPAPAASTPSGSLVPAAPSVRRLAREIGVDIASVPGTGPGGRISEEDVKAYSKKLHESRSGGTGGGGVAIAARDLPDFTKWGEVEREKMSRLRIAVADNMANAWNTIPHVTQEDRADITDLERMRKDTAELFEKEGGKLTPTAIALKIVGAALQKFPKFNASIDVANQEIVYKKFVNVGVAVDTDRGLVVPVIRDVPNKSLSELATELTEIAGKARDSKLGLDDMQGGTFTITNLGGLGTTQFTPIVNWPQVAILGISRGSIQPVWDKAKEAFEPRMIMPLSVSYDHRIIDGADAARFLRWIALAFEKPLLMV